jgi:hypothetical protein
VAIVYWGLLMLAVVVFTALLALLVVRVRRDWPVLSGRGITVEARVTGFEEGAQGGRYPVYAFTARSGRRYTVRGSLGGVLAPPLGATRRLIYLPGAEFEAEEGGLLGPVSVDAAVLGLTVLAGWLLLRMLGG